MYLFDVITLGSATVDVFAETSSELVKFVTAQGEKDFIAYPSGSKILVSSLNFLVGGGGTNTAVTFARQGFKTAFLGKIGNDEHSYQVLHLLEREKISFIGAKGGQTGYSIVLDSIEDDRTILAFKGSNNHLMPEDVGFHNLQTKWLYSSSMVGESFETLKLIFKHAKSQNTKIAFNPSSYQAKLGIARLQEIIDMCTVLIMNLEEAQLLTGKHGDAVELSTILGQDSERYVIVTDGSNGATCYYKGEVRIITPTPNLVVIETTGAGDAFASGFVSGLIHGLSIEDSLKFGLVQSESVIQSRGAKSNILTKDEAMKRIAHFSGSLRLFHDDGSLTSPATLFTNVKQRHNFKTTDRPFYFSNGHSVESLEELGYYLKFVSREVFSNHVKNNTNDFSTWIAEVFGEESLADQIKGTFDKFEMSKKIINFVHG